MIGRECAVAYVSGSGRGSVSIARWRGTQREWAVTAVGTTSFGAEGSPRGSCRVVNNGCRDDLVA